MYNSYLYKFHCEIESHRRKLFVPTVSVADLPDSIDWRLRGYVTEVKDQVRIENCIHVLIKALHTHNTYTYIVKRMRL